MNTIEKFKENFGIDLNSIPKEEWDKVLSEIDNKLDLCLEKELNECKQLLQNIDDLQLEIKLCEEKQ